MTKSVSLTCKNPWRLGEPTPSTAAQLTFPLNKNACFIGTIFQTYLLFQDTHELILIDQHAADERIRYEQLKHRIFTVQKQSQSLKNAETLSPAFKQEPNFFPSQILLVPESVSLPRESFTFFKEESLTFLTQIGFEVEFFGENGLVFRAIPAEWGDHEIKLRLTNLMHRIIDFNKKVSDSSKESLVSLLWDERWFEVLASEACHSSVRAGDTLKLSSIQKLINQLFKCEHPWNCPHGRPTQVKIPKGKLEEWFQRKLKNPNPSL